MSSTQPLKRNPALKKFSQDHHFALLCVWKIREGLSKSVSPERISRYVLYFFETDLRYHLRDEEEKVFVKLPKDNAMRIEAQEEHLAIYNLVEELRQNQGSPALLANFADTLEQYVRFEERQLFQYLQQVLTESDLDEITEAISPVKHEPEEVWSDAFWIQKNREPDSKIFSCNDAVEYALNSVVSKIIIKKPGGTVTLFAFDKGESLSEHTTPYEALALVTDGKAEIIIGGKINSVAAGQAIILPANTPHALKAKERFKMMLTMIKN